MSASTPGHQRNSFALYSSFGSILGDHGEVQTLLVLGRDDDSYSPHNAISLYCQLVLSLLERFQGLWNLLRPSSPSITKDFAENLVASRSNSDLFSGDWQGLNLRQVEDGGRLA